ncbi:non-specific lipid-transfer protein AP10-like [Corylus avellana]|uniref:non-specific lipid-transfer protein AP10-like n=1 Tax=Corylus avellana TaxID=13451 RepID=UPI00286D33BB|nr:non-specific lipid-transfer protein AP10-like [Corylus avellana]XP_059437309.1 non-specific lipid-transfer protein AP10-like [Corylus avellana]
MEKKMMGCVVLAFGLMFLALNASGRPSNDISCTDAVIDLLPCQSFLVSYGPALPTDACCQGAQAVLNQATTIEIRKSLCECFKKVGKDMNVNPEKAKQLPSLCKIDTPVPIDIDPNMDCSKIQ